MRERESPQGRKERKKKGSFGGTKIRDSERFEGARELETKGEGERERKDSFAVGEEKGGPGR